MTNCSVCNGPSTDHNCMEYLTGRVREIENANTWVSVLDKSPETEDYFIVRNDNESYIEISTCIYCPENGWNVAKNSGFNITHWMELPEPPKDKEQ